MAVFSVNQASRMYYGASVAATADSTNKTLVIEDGAGKTVEIIPESQVISNKTKTTADMNVKVAAPKLTVESSVAGYNYLVRLTIDAGTGNSYIKSVAVKADDATAENLAKKIAEKLNKAAERDIEIIYDATYSSNVVTITPRIMHTVGKRLYVPTIVVEGIDLEDGIKTPSLKATKATNVTLAGSGIQKLAELEYFCAGETGDVYRGAAWPNDIPFEGNINAASTKEYSVQTIHYYKNCGNEAVQKSEQTIYLVKATTTAVA